MAYTYTSVKDQITRLKIQPKEIEVTLKVHGTYKVEPISMRNTFDFLCKAEVGQTVRVATHRGQLRWIDRS